MQLIKKPINTLTYEELEYIYVIFNCWYLSKAVSFNSYEDAYDRFITYEDEEHGIRTYLRECYDFIHNLKFPLIIYRAIRKDELINKQFNINGKNHSLSWTTTLDIYNNPKSKFKNCGDIVSCKIDSDIIDVPNTINNFIHYSASNKTKNLFGEFEISLKSNYKQSDLQDLYWTDKDGNTYYDKIIENFKG